MTRLAALALCAGLLFSSAAPAAAQMQPGLWRFTQTTESGGRSRARTSTRCVSLAQAKDPAAYFQPRGVGCALIAHNTWAGRVTSTMRCAQGDTTSEITSTVRVASPTQISITTTMGVTSKAGRATVRLTGSGERIGNCGARRGKKKG